MPWHLVKTNKQFISLKPDQLSEKSLGLGLEIKRLALVLVLKIMEVLLLVLRSRVLLITRPISIQRI